MLYILNSSIYNVFDGYIYIHIISIRVYMLFYRHSLSVTPDPIICPSSAPQLSLSLSLSVCPAIKAYISVTMSLILMKLGESVGT